MTNRCKLLNLLITATALGSIVSSHALDLVNDTWQDSSRLDPASPTYAENNGSTSLDADADLNLESAWFRGGAGTLTPTPGLLQGGGYAGSSASWYTYFTSGSPVTLANAGDQLSLTWKFIPQTVNSGNNMQGFNVALALTPSGSRVTADASVPSAAYLGYATFMNMAPTFANANPFQLRRWNLAPNIAGALLGTSGNWLSVGNGATSGNTGFTSGTEYTFNMTLTRNVASGLDVVASITGGNINGTGSASVSYTDASASQGFSFDTFDIRPSSVAQTADHFDTESFVVQFSNVPEPSALALGFLGAGVALLRRNRRA